MQPPSYLITIFRLVRLLRFSLYAGFVFPLSPLAPFVFTHQLYRFDGFLILLLVLIRIVVTYYFYSEVRATVGLLQNGLRRVSFQPGHSIS